MDSKPSTRVQRSVALYMYVLQDKRSSEHQQIQYLARIRSLRNTGLADPMDVDDGEEAAEPAATAEAPAPTGGGGISRMNRSPHSFVNSCMGEQAEENATEVMH